MTQPERPISDSYWILPGRLLAGEYPGARSDAQARQKLARLLQAGVTFFLDLTEPGEYALKPYAPFLQERTGPSSRPLVHRRLPIPDRGTSSVPDMIHILDTLDPALYEGHTVYLHCWGGIGRTGTVVGCYLVRRQGNTHSGGHLHALVGRHRTLRVNAFFGIRLSKDCRNASFPPQWVDGSPCLCPLGSVGVLPASLQDRASTPRAGSTDTC